MGVGVVPRRGRAHVEALAPARGFATYEDKFSEYKTALSEEISEFLDVNGELPSGEFLLLQRRDKAKSGRAVFVEINRLLESMEDRWDSQIEFHKSMLMAIVRSIFKTDYTENLNWLHKFFGTLDFYKYLLIMAMRRVGKTTSTSMMAAACLCTIPDFTIAIYSNGSRASKMMREKIEHYVMKANNCRILVKNQETMVLLGSDGTQRRIDCYPASVRYFFFLFVPPKFFFLNCRAWIISGQQRLCGFESRIVTTKKNSWRVHGLTASTVDSCITGKKCWVKLIVGDMPLLKFGIIANSEWRGRVAVNSTIFAGARLRITLKTARV